MGSVWHKSDKTKEEVIEDILSINQITNNYLFSKKTNYLINFDISENFLANLFSNRIIICTLFRDEKGLRVIHKEVYLNLSQFYYFYNSTMNSLSIFYQDNVEKRYSLTKKDDSEEELCPICEDKKVGVMLECYVKK